MNGTSPHAQPVRLGHLGINCFDLDKMVDFYSRTIGLLVSDRGSVPELSLDVVFMTLDPSEHHQFILAKGRTEGEIRTDAFIGGGLGSAINQISFHISDLAELRRIRDRFAEFGLTNGSAIDHGNAWSIYIRDIEGNPLELYVDTPWYTTQPCGEPLDLSLSDEEIFARTEALCRSRPGFEPAHEWSARIAAQLEDLFATQQSR